MDNPNRDSFTGFLTCEWSNTHFMEIRANDDLLGYIKEARSLGMHDPVYESDTA